MASMKRRSSNPQLGETQTLSVSKSLNSTDSGPHPPLKSPHIVSIVKVGSNTLGLKTLMTDPLYIVENMSPNSSGTDSQPANKLLLAPMNQYVSSRIPSVILSVVGNSLTMEIPNIYPFNHFIVYKRKDKSLTVIWLPRTLDEVIEDAAALYYIAGKDATAFLTVDSIVDAIRRNAQDEPVLRNIDAIIQIIL